MAAAEERRRAYYKNPKRCKRCGGPIAYDKQINTFCGHSCSATAGNSGQVHSIESRQKVSAALLGREWVARVRRKCRLCRKEFAVTRLAKQWYCSSECGNATRPENIRKAQIASALAYRVDEQGPRAALNALFGTSFVKEKVCGYHFDFADAKHLIEHTKDYGKGIAWALRRFAAASTDGRTKILYANLKHFGPKRRARFDALGVLIRDYRDLVIS